VIYNGFVPPVAYHNVLQNLAEITRLCSQLLMDVSEDGCGQRLRVSLRESSEQTILCEFDEAVAVEIASQMVREDCCFDSPAHRIFEHTFRTEDKGRVLSFALSIAEWRDSPRNLGVGSSIKPLHEQLEDVSATNFV